MEVEGAMKQPLKVLLVEDNPVDAELALYELKKADFDCSARTVVTRDELIRELEAFEPDIILSDFSLPQFDGLSALELCQAARPDVPFIFLSGTIGEERALETLEKGAADYILKSHAKRLGAAVRRALKDAKDEASRKQLESQVRFLTRRDEQRHMEVSQRLARLTPRERQVLDLLVEGKASKMIAYLLGTSTRTIDVHRARVMEKMEADSLADLVRAVLEHRR
jgi:DNA-binding NarL/FixJ family response regulator